MDTQMEPTLTMTSEPLPLTLGDGVSSGNRAGIATKRKADDNSMEDGSSTGQAKKRKQTTGKTKKPRPVNELPSGLRILRMTEPPAPVATTSSSRQVPPSSSRHRSSSMSPPPSRRQVHPINPDDRPLPQPKPWTDGPSTSAHSSKPTKPPSTTSAKPSSKSSGRGPTLSGGLIRPPSRSGSAVPTSNKGKGRATNFAELDNSGETPDELEVLKELDGEIDELHVRRQDEFNKRKSTAPSSGHTTFSMPQPSSAKKPRPRPKNPHLPLTPTHHPKSGTHVTATGLHASTSAVPLPLNDTPMINKNKEMRSEQSGRRRSSVGQRSLRVSESFGAGVLAHPHPSVDSAEFYTHISPDFPDAIRTRQLLVWCSHRAATAPSTSATSLPPLTPNQRRKLDEIQEEVMKLMCMGKINTSLGSVNSSSTRPRKKIKEHPRNLENRKTEQRFLEKEARAQREEDAWSESLQALNARQATFLNALSVSSEKRKALPSNVLDWPIANDGQDPLLSQSAELLSEEMKSGIGDLDSAEKSLIDRMRCIEPLVDDISQGVHAASTLMRWSDSHLATFTRALSSRFRSRSANAGVGATSSSLKYPYAKAAHVSADPLSSLRALSRITREDGQSEAARQAALNLERGVGERRLTAIPATPSTRRTIAGTPRKSVGKRP